MGSVSSLKTSCDFNPKDINKKRVFSQYKEKTLIILRDGPKRLICFLPKTAVLYLCVQ
jgi:hypothetical protein